MVHNARLTSSTFPPLFRRPIPHPRPHSRFGQSHRRDVEAGVIVFGWSIALGGLLGFGETGGASWRDEEVGRGC